MSSIASYIGFFFHCQWVYMCKIGTEVPCCRCLWEVLVQLHTYEWQQLLMKKSHHALPPIHVPGLCKAYHKIHGCSVEWRLWQVKRMITASDFNSTQWEICLSHEHPVYPRRCSYWSLKKERKRTFILQHCKPGIYGGKKITAWYHACPLPVRL